MFLGHFGLGFGAKRAAPAVSLGTLFLAGQFADLLWPTLVLLGIEQLEVQPDAPPMLRLNFVRYPYSHSLLMLCAWGLVFGAVYAAVRRSRVRAAATLALLVVSHWVLDYVTHRPDLPLTPAGASHVGLGLWSSVPGTLAVEVMLFAFGIVIYARTTAPRDRAGSIGLWSLVMFLLVVYLGSVFGPPPPGASAVAWSAEAMWLLVLWGSFVDNHRLPHRN